MELGLLVAMLVFGLALGSVTAWRFHLSGRGEPRARPTREGIESSLLEAVSRAGRGGDEGGPGIDICTWAEGFAIRASRPERRELFERAVTMAARMNRTIPLAQYNALLELGFGLGLHSDALAVLRERLRFDYVDHARAGRPQWADRGATSLLGAEAPGEREALLRRLGLEGEATRAELAAAWRRVAAANHPDRFHAAGEPERAAASRRFIEATEAYERLLVLSAERPGRERKQS